MYFSVALLFLALFERKNELFIYSVWIFLFLICQILACTPWLFVIHGFKKFRIRTRKLIKWSKARYFQFRYGVFILYSSCSLYLCFIFCNFYCWSIFPWVLLVFYLLKCFFMFLNNFLVMTLIFIAIFLWFFAKFAISKVCSAIYPRLFFCLIWHM